MTIKPAKYDHKHFNWLHQKGRKMPRRLQRTPNVSSQSERDSNGEQRTGITGDQEGGTLSLHT